MPTLAELRAQGLLSTNNKLIVTPVTPAKHSPAVERAISVARGTTGLITQRHKLNPFKNWDDVEKLGDFVVPPLMRAQPVSLVTIRQVCDWYVNDTPARIERALAAAAVSNASVATPAWKDESLGGELLPFNLPSTGPNALRPIPRQRKSYTQAVRVLGLLDHNTYKSPPSHAALLPLEAGEGKTAVAAMLIKRYQDNKYFATGPDMFAFQDIIYITPKRVKVKTQRFFDRCGIKDIGVRVIVTTYNELRSKSKQQWYKAVKDIDPTTGEEIDTYIYSFAPMCWPDLLIVDESHTIKKPKTETCKRVRALIGPQTRVLYMSATSAVTVNDLATFAITSQIPYDGRPITNRTWSQAAWAIGNADPKKPNKAAMERAAKFFGDAIIKPPRDPRKIKCTNKVVLCDFKTDQQRAFYMAAQERWLEQCDKLGKIPSERGAVMAATQNFCGAEELIKAETFADRAISALAEGKNPVIGVLRLDTVKETYGYLMHRTHPLTGKPLTRDNISVIWGGEKIILPEEVFSIQEFMQLQQKVANELDNDESLLEPAKVRAKYRKTKKYFQDRWKRVGKDGKPETQAEQAERVRWLKETKLDAQGEVEQQAEMDKFQSGKTDICIFTLSAGGTGVDLDQQHEGTRPRKMISTITYYLEQFIQAFGRCYRVSTISDVEQEVIFFRGTIVADHVAPKLAKKIESINAFSATGVNLEDDLVAAVVSGKVTTPVRDEELIPVEQSDALDEDLDADDDDNDTN